MEKRSLGLLDRWLSYIGEVYSNHRELLEPIADPEMRARRLCELNVAQQVANVCHTEFVERAWAGGCRLAVHGWIYDLATGLLRDLDLCITGPGQIPRVYRGG
jgi:carbonic anhydrase